MPNKKIESYFEELRKLSSVLYGNSSAEEKSMAMARVKEIEQESGNTSGVQDHMNRLMIEGVTGKSYDKVEDAQKKVLKAQFSSQLALGALQAGAGIAQIVNATKKGKELKAPNLPQTQSKNSLLSNQINKALVRSEQGDPKRTQFYKEQLAELEALNNQRAKSSGNSGQYLGNIQANAGRTNRALRQFTQDEDSRRRSDRGELNNLIRQSINEDFRLLSDNWRRYGAKERNYNQSFRAIQSQKNSGFNNAFIGAASLANSAPGLALMGNGRQPTPNHVNDPVDLSTLTDNGDIHPYNPPVPRSSPNPQTPTFSIGNLGLMGAPSNRTPENIYKYQQELMANGVQINDVLGEWGEDTEAVFKRSTQPDMFGYAQMMGRALTN